MDSRGRPLLLIAVLALVGLGLWVASGSSMFGAPAPEPGPTRQAAEPGDARRDPAAAPGPQRDPSREALARAAADAVGSAAPGLTVRVVDDVTDAPVEGAEVGYQVADRESDYVPGPERELRAWAGTILRTDVDGEVRIDAATDGMWTVYARKDDRWGEIHVTAAEAEGPHVLRLQLDNTLRVQVVDGAGRPVVGVPVTIANAHDFDRRGGGGWREPTAAPDGIATFPHVQARLPEAWGERAVAILDFPLPELVFAPLRVDALPAMVVLRLPATGALRVRLVDGEGLPFHPLDGTAWCSLHQESDRGDRGHWVALPGGVLELPHTGLGLRFRLVLDNEECRGAMTFAGPTVPGELVAVDLPVTVHPTLQGRLLDVHGTPQSGHWYATHVHQAPGWYNQYFETGDDGRFAISFPELDGNDGRPRGIVFRRTLRDDAQLAWVDVGLLALHAGRNELGDVVLRPAPTLVAGRVVDDAGDAVPAAELTVFQGDPDGAYWAVATLDEGDSRSDAAGEFTVRGHAIGDALLLRAGLGDAHGELLPFRREAVGVTYVLPHAGALEMRVTTTNGLPAAALVFVLRDLATGRIEGRISRYVLKDGVMQWGGLRPGRYDLEVRAVGVEQPLAARRDVAVEGGRTLRLDDLELGAELHKVAIRLTDRAGQPVPRASVVVAPPFDDGRPRAALSTAVGQVELFAPRLPLDLLVFAPGFRTARVPGVSGDRTIALEPGLRVEVRATWPAAALPAAARLVPLLREAGAAGAAADGGDRFYLYGNAAQYRPERHAWLWQQENALDAAGRARLEVPGPGDYELAWRLELPGDWRELDVPPRPLSVADGGGPVVVEVALPAAALRR